MGLLADSFCEAIRPKEKTSPYAWASGGKILIPNSAVSSQYEPDSSPWFLEPLDYFASGRMREGYVIAPTGSGKTTLFDLLIPYIIARDPGSILAIQETDPDAADYAEKRLNPILDSCDEIKPLLDSLARHKRKGVSIALPHMDLSIVGANPSSAQRVSKRYVLGDEVWKWKHGLVGEFRARMHDRWNRVALWVSQGGDETFFVKKEEFETELFAGWKTSDQRAWHMQCPECGEVQPFSRKSLHWTIQDNDKGELDVPAIVQSTHLKCSKCELRFDDNPINRRTLADSGRYVVTNPNHTPGIHGWTYNALTVYRIPWSEFAVAWTLAKRALAKGDRKPLQICIQKRLAEFWRVIIETPRMDLTAADYSKADYQNGELVDNEVVRLFTVDRQMDHYWGLIRAWRADGSSRLLFEGKILTKESIREIQLRYKVKDKLTFQDARYMSGQVYNECAEYGWTALHGEGNEKTFRHQARGRVRAFRAFYSPLVSVRAPHSRKMVQFARWANEGVKDELVQYRHGGRRPDFEFPKDVSEDWLKHMVSEVKIGDLYDNQKRDNHLWDCEAMGVAAAMMIGIISGVAAPEDTGAPVDTDGQVDVRP